MVIPNLAKSLETLDSNRIGMRNAVVVIGLAMLRFVTVRSELASMPANESRVERYERFDVSRKDQQS